MTVKKMIELFFIIFSFNSMFVTVLFEFKFNSF